MSASYFFTLLNDRTDNRVVGHGWACLNLVHSTPDERMMLIRLSIYTIADTTIVRKAIFNEGLASQTRGIFVRVCVLETSYTGSTSEMMLYDGNTYVGEYLEALGHTWEMFQIDKGKAVQEVRALILSGKYDIFLNLCDGAYDDDTAGIEVVRTLQQYNVPYTGADENYYDPNREEMKLVCDAWGVKTPGYIRTTTLEDVSLALANLHFPMIVKHFMSYSSVGLKVDSRVDNESDLYHHTERMLKAYGEVIIEEFIDGKEYTVLVVENPDDPMDPILYTPAMYNFPEHLGAKGFKHFDMKWVTFHDMQETMVTDPQLSDKLKDLTRKVFLGHRGTGYGRCDFRANMEGEIFLLEINPQCGVFYHRDNPGSVDYILLNEKGGYPHGHIDFVQNILKAAFKRVKPPQKWRILYNKDRQFGLYAQVEISKGETIIEYEGQPHYLVSTAYVEEHFTDLEKDWFRNYAYPVSEKVWAIWSPSPKDWKPINHSCDPNAWLQGLNLVACRDIRKNEEITIEYATFMNGKMPPFECLCGSPNCRKVIYCSECDNQVIARYNGHLSCYVEQKWDRGEKTVDS